MRIRRNHILATKYSSSRGTGLCCFRYGLQFRVLLIIIFPSLIVLLVNP